MAPRILILGGGFGGVYTARHLERLLNPQSAQITLVSRDNYFLMTPLLFEAGSGVLEPRHAVNPIRPLLRHARFIEAEVEGIDLDNRRVYARHAPGFEQYALPYDHLVLALGGITNRSIIPGSEHALSFKTLADAIFVRNHIIDLFERADMEADAKVRQSLLRFIVIGAGLVGVELMGEMTQFVRTLSRSYPRVRAEEIQFHLIEAGPRLLPEMEQDLAEHAEASLRRRGVDVRIAAPVTRIGPDAVYLADEQKLCASTIILAAGVLPSPLLKDLPVERDARGRIIVQPTMRVPGREGLWALGDCAAIPDHSGKPYPPLAQHAIRQAKVLAQNIASTVKGATGNQPPQLQPFIYQSLGTLASLGHFDGVGRVMRIKFKGFAAWWIWRTYYLLQMPRFERRLRIVLDWTVALLFKNDIVKLDLFGEEHPVRRRNPK